MSVHILVVLPDRDLVLRLLAMLGVICLATFVLVWPLIAVEIGKRRGNLVIMLGSLGGFFDPKPYLPGGSQYRGQGARRTKDSGALGERERAAADEDVGGQTCSAGPEGLAAGCERPSESAAPSLVNHAARK